MILPMNRTVIRMINHPSILRSLTILSSLDPCVAQVLLPYSWICISRAYPVVPDLPNKFLRENDDTTQVSSFLYLWCCSKTHRDVKRLNFVNILVPEQMRDSFCGWSLLVSTTSEIESKMIVLPPESIHGSAAEVVFRSLLICSLVLFTPLRSPGLRYGSSS